MLAVIETGGKQYIVKAGESIKIEKLDAEKGAEVVFDKVLLVSDEEGNDVKVGTPFVEGSKITGLVEEQGRAKKIRVVKYKRKVRYKRVAGHRQPFTKVKIIEIA